MSTIKVTNIQNPSASSAALVLNTDGTCSQLGVRNAIINGNPIINQRGYVSGTATTAANQYTLDRWRVITSGQSITWTDSGNVRTVTAPAGGVEQVIEGINLITGTYTLNWTGTATATVAGNAVAKGGNVSITGGTDTTLRFSSGTFSLVQFEPGTVATPFERRSYGAELALCQRYFEKSFDPDTAPANGANSTSLIGTPVSVFSQGNLANTTYRYCTVKRAVPTITYYGNNAGQVLTATSGVGAAWTTVAGIINVTSSQVGLNAYVTSAAFIFLAFQFTASAEL